MNDEAQQRPIEKKSPWYTRLFKWLFFISAFFLVAFTVLANAGGDGDFYKQTIENYFRDTTGYHASVGQLNGVTLFPSVSFDFQDLELRQAPEDDTPVASIASVSFRMGFWDVALSTAKIKALDVRDVVALPGVFLRESVLLKKLAIEDNNLNPDHPEAVLVAEGDIGGAPLSFHTDLDVFGSRRKRKYRFGAARDFELSLGTLRAKGLLDRGVFDNIELSLAEQPVLAGKFVLERQNAGSLRFYGDLVVSEHETPLQPDILIERRAQGWVLSGDVQSAALHVEDFISSSRLQTFFGTLSDIFGKPKREGFSLPLGGLDLNVSADSVMLGKANLGALNLPVIIKDDVLSIVLNDHFSLSEVTSDITLKAVDGQAQLAVDIALKNFDYGALQEKLSESAELTGKADVMIKLTAEASSLSALPGAMNGKISFIGGQGKLGSNIVNLWGGGLVNALLPDLNPEEKLYVNCTIMDFSIEKGLASSNAFFLDGTHVTVAGEGTYNLVEDALDITLTPKPKDIAIGDIAAGVKISGSLSAPSIGPDLRGIGRKIGGLLLGVVNPAFLAYSLTDLGLNEDHPCAAYLSDVEEIREVPVVERSGANE